MAGAGPNRNGSTTLRVPGLVACDGDIPSILYGPLGDQLLEEAGRIAEVALTQKQNPLRWPKTQAHLWVFIFKEKAETKYVSEK